MSVMARAKGHSTEYTENILYGRGSDSLNGPPPTFVSASSNESKRPVSTSRHREKNRRSQLVGRRFSVFRNKRQIPVDIQNN